MYLIIALLTVALHLPAEWTSPHTQVESPEERRERVEMIVEEAVRVAQSRPSGWPGSRQDLAVSILATTYSESRWSYAVHAGYKRGDGGVSCGLGQLFGECDDVGIGRVETRRHLRRVAEHLAFHARRCRVRYVTVSGFARIQAGYLTGNRCAPRGLSAVPPRVRLWSRFRAAVHTVARPTRVASR